MHFQLRCIIEEDESGKPVLKLITEGLPTIQREQVLALLSSQIETIQTEAGEGINLFLLTIEVSATDTFPPRLQSKKCDEQG